MKVRFARGVGISLMVAGAAVVLVSLGFAFAGTPEIGIVSLGGLGLIAFGWLYLGRLPYFVLTDAELVVPIQPAHRTALRGGRLDVDGNRLVISRPGEEPRKLPVYRGYAHPDDWAKVVAAIAQGGQRS